MIVERWLSWFYRQRCVGCGDWSPGLLCRPCESGWPAPLADVCGRCAMPLGNGAHACASCAQFVPPFTATLAAAPYEGVVRRVVCALKYQDRRGLAPVLASRLAHLCVLPGGRWAVVPVPLHRDRQQQRGYNQARLLARGLSRTLNLPLLDALTRPSRTEPQSGLDRRDRQRNMTNAFLADKRVAGRPILLVDDVMTTGATATACAVALLDAGASEVRVAVVARTMASASKP